MRRLAAFGLLACTALGAASCSPGAHGSVPPAARDAALQRAVADVSPSPGIVATVTIHPAQTGPQTSAHVLGANMAMWYDVTQPGIAQSLAAAGITASRWPGGSSSDQYHWQSHTLCAGGYADPHATFDAFMQDVALPAHLSMTMTLDYGSNAQCSAGGDPAEAAAWVDYANNVKQYQIKRWTVGNESYGSWEYDLHARPHDAATYAAAVANGFYPQIKAKSPAAQVGIVVEPGWSPAWDPIVLQNAPYDYVELHWYAQTPGRESDAYLVQQAPQALTATIKALQSELAAAGRPQTPIVMGELGSVYANPGKQTTSISQALFAGEAIDELLADGVEHATWWLGYGGCSEASGGNFAASLYGWQSFGGYMMFSDGTPEYGCTGAPAVPRGTPLPTARAFQVLSTVVRGGEHTLGTTLGGTSSNLRAYALSYGSGYALVLYNLTGQTAAVSATVDGFAGPAAVTTTTYGKAQYDQSQNGVWAGPVTAQTRAPGGSITLTLPPGSMTAAVIAP